VRRAGAPAEIALRPIGRGRIAALIRERSGAARPAPPAQPAQAVAATREAPNADLMADLAHELKTPLNAIIGFADAMRAETFGPLGSDELSAEKYVEYVNHIHASGTHLAALIGAAQDYARQASGQYLIERAPADPGVLANECAEMLRGAADAAGLSLTVDIAPDLPAAMLDARAVKQVLINLLSNAVKFTKEGGVDLSVRLEDGRLVFAVRDTGVGMNKMMVAKLGGRYSDVHREGVRGAGGSGLGLSLAFELARLHGGALTIDSAPGEGTLARFSTPIGEAAPIRSGGAPAADIQSQLDRVNAFRAERNRAGRAA
jgi:cell cycle sensor histidine kinase DivJ